MALGQWTDHRRNLALMVLLTLERSGLVPTTRPSSHGFALRARLMMGQRRARCRRTRPS